jgi:hypothetical protein
MRHVFTGVGFDELIQQAVDCTANGRDQMQGLRAIGVGLKRPLNGLDLP